jgi:hypothetical protein
MYIQDHLCLILHYPLPLLLIVLANILHPLTTDVISLTYTQRISLESRYIEQPAFMVLFVTSENDRYKLVDH